jgi:Domain of unknown function (DUF4340)
MNETIKTILFVALGAVASLGAWSSTRPPAKVANVNQVGSLLFPDFKDPYVARSLRVASYDEKLGKLREFEVAQKNGDWVIPSHQDYPADAAENLAAAATLLIDLKALDQVSDKKQDQKQFSVIEPNEESIKAGESGVGKLVVLEDAKGDVLAGLIIGAEVQGKPDQRYVRVPGRDQIYVATIDPSKLSTKFEDWIKTDLLEIAGFDIQELAINDYSANPVLTQDGRLSLDLDPRFETTLIWNDADFKWELKEIKEFIAGEFKATELAVGEQLNKEKLDDMKAALDDLKIVDVMRKPPGLRPSSSAEENILNDREALESLLEHGFFPSLNEDKSLKLFCSDGEVTVTTKDGVELKLSFGGQAASVGEAGSGQLNRYVMVSAQPNTDRFEKPVVATPPEATDEAAKAAADAALKEQERKLNEYNEKVKKAQDKARDLNYRLGEWYFVVAEDVYNRIHLNRSGVIKDDPKAATEGVGVDAFRSLEDEGLRKVPE